MLELLAETGRFWVQGDADRSTEVAAAISVLGPLSAPLGMIDVVLTLESLPRCRAWRAVPWGEPCGGLASTPLRLHTVQTEGAYRVLAESGVLCGDPSLSDQVFVDAYAWLAGEMDRRLPTTGPGMLWGWARITRRQLVSNVRCARGEVLLTVEVARERVLLHNYEDWHAVLNHGLLVPCTQGETVEEWWKRAEPLIDDFDARLGDSDLSSRSAGDWPVELREELLASWAAIFDPATWSASECIQATLHELRASDVVRAVRIR